MDENVRYCTRCGFLGKHGIDREITGGQWATLVVLLLCGVLPGVLYGGWLSTGHGARRLYRCPSCGGHRVSVPPDAPIARRDLAAQGREAPPEMFQDLIAPPKGMRVKQN